MRFAGLALAPLLLLCACSGPGAPQDAGVCWRAGAAASGPAGFKPVAHNVDSLEACAVLLEAMRLQGAPEVDGAYQGYFIFADPNGISSALHTGGLRYPIFQPPQRASVDRDLNRLMQEHGGKLPDAGALSLERH
jgi:hypothetical protein